MPELSTAPALLTIVREHLRGLRDDPLHTAISDKAIGLKRLDHRSSHCGRTTGNRTCDRAIGRLEDRCALTLRAHDSRADQTLSTEAQRKRTPEIARFSRSAFS